MIQFKVFDRFLELKKDTSFSFSFINSIFAFDKIELKRTQEFTIPATSNNNLALKHANRPDFDGLFARTILDAEMWYSGGKIEGKLYISSATEKEYKCVFVFGEMLKLKSIKEAGKIKDYSFLNDNFKWRDGTPTLNYYDNFCLYKYKITNFDETAVNVGWNFMPSVYLGYLIDNCAIALGISVDYSNIIDKVRQLYIKLNGMNLAGVELAPESLISVTSGFSQALDYYGFPPALFVQEYTNDYSENALVAQENVKVTFTPEFPDNYGTTKFFIYVLNDGNVPVKIFTKESMNVAEVAVNVYKGQKITMVSADYASNTWRNYPIPMTCKYTAFDEKVEYGGDYYLQPNHPDLTFIDLLKIVANATNTAILYDEETSVISFFDFETWENPVNLEGSVIKKGTVSRVFNDFAQKNTINCKDSEPVLKENAVTGVFYLQNETLEKENELYTIPLSGGNNYGLSTAFDGVHKFLQLSDIIKNVDELGVITYEFGKDADTLCEFVAGSDYLQQVIFDQNPNFLNLLNKSTQIELTVKMYFLEFQQIKYNTTFSYRGIKYCVISAKWSKDQCNLILQRM